MMQIWTEDKAGIVRGKFKKIYGETVSDGKQE